MTDVVGSVRSRVKAPMRVHIYGQTADMLPLMDLARDHGLRVIEDAAQAIGSEDADHRRACSFGDSGMYVTNGASLVERMDILRVHGAKPKYQFNGVLGATRASELAGQAARAAGYCRPSRPDP